MLKLMMKLMAEADNGGGGGDNPPNPPTPPNPPAPPANDPPTPPAPPAPPKADEHTLLDDDPTPPAPPANDPPPTNTPPAGPTEEEVKTWTDGVKALDLGEGIKFDDETLKAITPSLMELTGKDSKKAEGLLKAYVTHQQSLVKAAQDAENAFVNGLITEAKNRFGEDLKAKVQLAKEGGLAVFGEKLWSQMRTIKTFANNPDVIERLAMMGSRFHTDNGKVIPKGGEEAPKGDVLSRMYGNIKI